MREPWPIVKSGVLWIVERGVDRGHFPILMNTSPYMYVNMENGIICDKPHSSRPSDTALAIKIRVK